jgi:hypothetical protein
MFARRGSDVVQADRESARREQRSGKTTKYTDLPEYLMTGYGFVSFGAPH